MTAVLQQGSAAGGLKEGEEGEAMEGDDAADGGAEQMVGHRGAGTKATGGWERQGGVGDKRASAPDAGGKGLRGSLRAQQQQQPPPAAKPMQQQQQQQQQKALPRSVLTAEERRLKFEAEFGDLEALDQVGTVSCDNTGYCA
jgi:hypothetical protein